MHAWDHTAGHRPLEGDGKGRQVQAEQDHGQGTNTAANTTKIGEVTAASVAAAAAGVTCRKHAALQLLLCL